MTLEESDFWLGDDGTATLAKKVFLAEAHGSMGSRAKLMLTIEETVWLLFVNISIHNKEVAISGTLYGNSSGNMNLE